MKTYHIRKITNGKPGDYLVDPPSQYNRLGIWVRDTEGAMEYGKKEGKEARNEIYTTNNIQTRLERISEI